MDNLLLSDPLRCFQAWELRVWADPMVVTQASKEGGRQKYIEEKGLYGIAGSAVRSNQADHRLTVHRPNTAEKHAFFKVSGLVLWLSSSRHSTRRNLPAQRRPTVFDWRRWIRPRLRSAPDRGRLYGAAFADHRRVEGSGFRLHLFVLRDGWDAVAGLAE
jgi:hypothetical protein